MPAMRAHIAHAFDLFASSTASSYCPALYRSLTLHEWMIDMMPKGRQQKSVVRIAHTRLLLGGGKRSIIFHLFVDLSKSIICVY